MTGLAGGTVSPSRLSTVLDGMCHEDWYGRETFGRHDRTMGLVHHADVDPDGHRIWENGDRFGAIYGAISNREALDIGDAALFDRLLNQPTELAAKLDGQFLIAAFDGDADRFVIVTDRLGSRPCYYTTSTGFGFGSELTAPMSVLDDPVVDSQAVSDMLLLGHMWGQRTLLTEVSTIPPASVLVYEDGEATVQRYWTPSFDPRPATDEYRYRLVREYQGAVDHTSRTLSGTAGLWLSGGLDSRATANELHRNACAGAFEELVAYTYDANPAGGKNPKLAADVAETLGIGLQEVPLTADDFARQLDRVVDITDGMIQWNTLVNLSAVLNLPDDAAGVIMEGIEGALLGHHLNHSHLTAYDDVVESQLASEGARDVETVQEVLDYAVDPLATLRGEARRTDENTFVGKVLDIHFQNYYPRLALASNHLARSQIGTRVPYTNASFLEHVARLPLSDRMQTLPFTDGKIPYGVTRPKLSIIRSLDQSLAAIPYERTSVPATWPLPLHVAGFVASTSIARLRGQTTYGGPSMLDHWYRESDALRAKIDDLVDVAAQRVYFDANTVLRLRDEHLAGDDNHIDLLAPITTLESWFQQHIDDGPVNDVTIATETTDTLSPTQD